MDGADVCRTSSRASRRPPDVISTAAILNPRWRRRKWRHPGPGARFSIPVVEGGGKWRPFRFRSPSWVTSFAGTGNEVTQDGDRKRKGRHFPPPSTIGIEKRALYYSCRLFQKSISAARHGRPSTARPHGPLWRTSETIGVRNPCRLFKKVHPAARHGQPSTARSDKLLKQSAWGIRAVCFKSPFRRPVTDVRHGPLWRISETNGAPYDRDMAPSSLLSVFSMFVIFVSMVRSWPRRGDGFPPTLPFGVLTCSPRDGESLLMSRGSALGARGYWTENSRQSTDNGCNRTQGCN